MTAFIRMSKIKKALIIVMLAFYTIMIAYMGLGFMYALHQRQAFENLDIQYRSMTLTEDYTNYDFIKKERTYQMGVKTRAESKFKDNVQWTLLMTAIFTPIYVLAFYTLGKTPAKKEYRRAEDYPFPNQFIDEDDRPEVQ